MVRAVEGEQREQVRNRDPAVDLAVEVDPADREARAVGGLIQSLDRRELRRLLLRDGPRRPVADDDLGRCGQRQHRERHDEGGAVVAVALSPQPSDGVDAGDQRARDDEPGEVHVDLLVPEVRVEQRRERVDVGHLAVRGQREALRVVHPPVDGDHRGRAEDARRGDDKPAQEVGALGQPVPAVDVDRDEDRLDEEGETLDREREAEDLAELLHELRPQQAELEREDRAGDDADREQDQHHLRPALGHGLVDRVARAQ